MVRNYGIAMMLLLTTGCSYLLEEGKCYSDGDEYIHLVLSLKGNIRYAQHDWDNDYWYGHGYVRVFDYKPWEEVSCPVAANKCSPYYPERKKDWINRTWGVNCE